MIIPRLPHRIVIAIASIVVLGLALSAATALFCNALTVRSVVLGVTLAVANLYVLGLALTALVFSDFDPSVTARLSAAAKTAWGVIALTKVIVLFVAVAFVLRRGIATPLPLVLGYMTLPFGIAIGSIVSDRAPTKPRGSFSEY